ncbi:hypothetical protein [Methylobacterium aquaticum]|uniref:Uncharacterized protein n=1 Tax=Methylobacterium aquaticum TaxID=270351 RepID=A0A0C6FC28_9HYPH|nr:hypothetical protein [Methylobacterium aquaticum]BAQ50246.1 hypothetical protein Maq22A_2p42580 [Methylobacterium aquaticum]
MASDVSSRPIGLPAGGAALHRIAAELRVTPAAFADQEGPLKAHRETASLLRDWSTITNPADRQQVLDLVEALAAKRAAPPVWTPLKAVYDAGTIVHLDVSGTADLRLLIGSGDWVVTAIGVDDMGELIEAFSLAAGETVSCVAPHLTVVQIDGGEVLYRTAYRVVRMPRALYDRIAGMVASLIVDPAVQAAVEAASMEKAATSRAAAWMVAPG